MAIPHSWDAENGPGPAEGCDKKNTTKREWRRKESHDSFWGEIKSLRACYNGLSSATNSKPLVDGMMRPLALVCCGIYTRRGGAGGQSMSAQCLGGLDKVSRTRLIRGAMNWYSLLSKFAHNPTQLLWPASKGQARPNSDQAEVLL